MRVGIRIFGTFRGIGPEAYEALKPHLEFDEVSYKDDVVEVDHERWHPDLDGVAQAVSEVMAEGFLSGLDEINHDANLLTRYEMRRGEVKSIVRDLDDVVRAYEHGG